jgi:hypothetical protein
MDMKKLALILVLSFLALPTLADRNPASDWPTGIIASASELATLIPTGLVYPESIDPWEVKNDENCESYPSPSRGEICYTCWRSKIVNKIDDFATKAEDICFGGAPEKSLRELNIEVRGGQSVAGPVIKAALDKTLVGAKKIVEDGVQYWITKTQKIGFLSTSRTTSISFRALPDPSEVNTEGGICKPEEVAGDFRCGAFGVPWRSTKEAVFEALGLPEDYRHPISFQGESTKIEGNYELAPDFFVSDPWLSFDDGEFEGVAISRYDDPNHAARPVTTEQLDQILELNKIVVNRSQTGFSSGDIHVVHDRRNKRLRIDHTVY